MDKNKKLRVEVLDGLSSVEIENEINAFLYHLTNIEVIDIKITTSMFVYSGRQQCYYVALVQYYK